MIDHGRIVDWVLGAVPRKRARPIEQAIAEDPRAQREAAEVRRLVDAMRTLTVEPSGAVPLALHSALARWARALPRGSKPPWLRWAGGAIAGALLVGAGLLWSSEPPRAAPAAARAESDGVRVGAPEQLARLREEYGQRFSPDARRASILRTGGAPGVEDRIDALAATLAAAVTERIAGGATSVADAALALRALLASGSGPGAGHRRAVAEAEAFLAGRIAALEGPELATALAGLVDFAVIADDSARALVAEHATRLARATLAPAEARPPHALAHAGAPAERVGLLRFETESSCFADAGRVFAVAPAFGMPPDLARDARRLVCARLQERSAESGGERPELLAALCYGFGDLVDRDELERRLLLWRPGQLAGGDLVALHHWAFSRFPPREGWAEFQRALRELAAMETPPRIRDAAALLLCLSMSFAAPGAHGLHAAD